MARDVTEPRLATIADVPQLVEARAAHLTSEPIIDGSWLEAARVRLENGMRTGDVFAALIEDTNGRVVSSGVGIVTHHVPHPTNPTGAVGYIHSMFTIPERRGAGLGRAVLNLLLRTFAVRGVERVELSSSRAGKSLYERAGFRAPERGVPLRLELRGDVPVAGRPARRTRLWTNAGIAETRRLRLHPLTIEDAAALLPIVNDADVTRHIPVEPQTLESERAFIASVLAEAPRLGHHFAVIETSTAEVIGHARFGVAEGIGPDLSYMLRKDRWGRGFGTEVARCLVDFGFDVLGLDEIFVTCAPDNAASLHVIEKVGFSFVERRERHMTVQGEARDSLVLRQSRHDRTGSE